MAVRYLWVGENRRPMNRVLPPCILSPPHFQQTDSVSSTLTPSFLHLPLLIIGIKSGKEIQASLFIWCPHRYRILEWVACPTPGKPSWSRDQTHVSCLLHLPVSSSPRVLPGKPVLYMAVCTCASQPPNLSFPVSFPFGNHEPVFHVCGSVSLLYISSVASLFLSSLVSHVSGSVCHVSLASFT